MPDHKDVLKRLEEFYDGRAPAPGDHLGLLEAAMFVELEFDIVLDDRDITDENLAFALSAAALVMRRADSTAAHI